MSKSMTLTNRAMQAAFDAKPHANGVEIYLCDGQSEARLVVSETDANKMGKALTGLVYNAKFNRLEAKVNSGTATETERTTFGKMLKARSDFETRRNEAKAKRDADKAAKETAAAPAQTRRRAGVSPLSVVDNAVAKS